MSDVDVLAWLRQAKVATLCTLLHDARAPGAPFGSVVPYDLDVDGRLSVVISDIAVHTKNLRADPRCSVVVADPAPPGGDAQAGWRVTLVGAMRELPGQVRSDVHGFHRFVLDVAATRWIAGFGRMGWI